MSYPGTLAFIITSLIFGTLTIILIALLIAETIRVLIKRKRKVN